MDNIKTGVRKPAESTRGTVVGPSIERGVCTPSSSFDKRADVGTVAYVGPSKKENYPSMIKGGKGQSKKHKSTGKGQR